MLSSCPAVARYGFLDIEVDALTLTDLNSLVERAIVEKRRLLIGNHNLHSLYLFQRSEAMRSFYGEADCIHADGISIVWLARLLGFPLSAAHRTGYMDWLPEMMRAAMRRHWRVFYLGSRPGVLDDGLSRLRWRWPGLQIDGHHGYFDKLPHAADNVEIVRQIARYRPDLLLVGMGMPVQEEWIVNNRGDLPACTIVACGALMDYVAGTIPTPPRYLGSLGLEWAFRLATEPRRLARRYLVEPWSVLRLLQRHLQTRHTGSLPNLLS